MITSTVENVGQDAENAQIGSHCTAQSARTEAGACGCNAI